MRTDIRRLLLVAASVLLVAACGSGDGADGDGGAAPRRVGVVPTSAPMAVQVSIDERRWERAERTMLWLPAWTLVESSWLGGDARTAAVEAAWREAGVPWELDFRVPPGGVEWFGAHAGAALLGGDGDGGIGWVDVRRGAAARAAATAVAEDAYGGSAVAGTYEGAELHEGEADEGVTWWAIVGGESLVVASSRAALEASIDANAGKTLESTRLWRRIAQDDRATRLVWGRAPGFTTAAIGVSKEGPWALASSLEGDSAVATMARTASVPGAAPQLCSGPEGSLMVVRGLPRLNWDAVLAASTCGTGGATTAMLVSPLRLARTLLPKQSATRAALIDDQLAHIESIDVTVRRGEIAEREASTVDVRVTLA